MKGEEEEGEGIRRPMGEIEWWEQTRQMKRFLKDRNKAIKRGGIKMRLMGQN